MELWELTARESIRDLVARYNANGDSGRFTQVLELFASDASMVLDDGVRTGHDEILTIFVGARETLTAPAARPAHLRHMTATLQIDLLDRMSARSRCYFQVLTPIGLDHWGRYLDEYRVVDGIWKFARRQVTIDGSSPGSVFGTLG